MRISWEKKTRNPEPPRVAIYHAPRPSKDNVIRLCHEIYNSDMLR